MKPGRSFSSYPLEFCLKLHYNEQVKQTVKGAGMAQRSKNTKATGKKRKVPSIVGINVASGSHEYLVCLHDLGLFEGAIGATRLHPAVKPVIDALHHVLSGGKVELRVLESGNTEFKRDLDVRLEQSLKETNQINRQVRYPLTVAV